jgi:hypothetical protein
MALGPAFEVRNFGTVYGNVTPALHICGGVRLAHFEALDGDLSPWHLSERRGVRFSNRPSGVKHFQAIHPLQCRCRSRARDSTIDAAALCKMAERGRITGGICA